MDLAILPPSSLQMHQITIMETYRAITEMLDASDNYYGDIPGNY